MVYFCEKWLTVDALCHAKYAIIIVGSMRLYY